MWGWAMMRGEDRQSGSLFSYVDLEARVAADQPLRSIRTIVNDALSGLSSELEALYSPLGRPSVPPERLLRALLLQAFYSIRSERLLMEQLDYNLLYRWFVGLGIDDPVWHPTAFTTNRDRLLAGEVAAGFLAAVLSHPQVTTLLSREHFTMDGTLVEAWASLKGFRPKDDRNAPPDSGRNASRDFHGERRTNDSPSRSAPTPRRPWVPAKRPPTRTRACSARAPRQGGQALLHGPRADGEPPRLGVRGPADPRCGLRRAPGGGRTDRRTRRAGADHRGRRSRL